MGTIGTIKFRNDLHDVEFKSHGYEADVNAHDIDWEFMQKSMNDLVLTAAEEQDIYEQILELLNNLDQGDYY